MATRKRTQKKKKKAKKETRKTIAVKLKVYDFTAEDEEIAGDLQSKLVSTGFSGSEAATDLDIAYHNGWTYVVPVGEYQNADPWKFKGKVPASKVLKIYRGWIKE